jgi:type I restriction enzyme R subunit
MVTEPEFITRKKRIDKRLRHLEWRIIPNQTGLNYSGLAGYAVEEYPTRSGQADYAMFVEGKLLGIIEAKKLTVAPENALEQAKRYSKGVTSGVGLWRGYKVPFLYSSNGEEIYHLDIRNEKNISRQIDDFHTPEALKELFERDDYMAFDWLKQNPVENKYLRPYQKEAIQAIEKALSDSRRKMMVAMATGTGKTFTIINLVYRLLKSKLAKRVLFLVDRRSLASQAVRAFASFDTPEGLKFNKEYEIYSQQFKKDDLEQERFKPEVLPNKYLTKPDETKTFIYISTIQRMAINLYGREAIFKYNMGDAEDEADAETLPGIPIHAFDVIIADECHRGYTSKETNLWRSVLNHFDAVKIGLTATPAAHTIAFFNDPIYKYTVEQAIQEGYLVDYDAVKINSNVLMNGVFLKEGEQVGVVDTVTGREFIDQLEDEREFYSEEIEKKITSPDTVKKVIQEVAKYASDFERKNNRFPKTLIFAVNDIAFISHSDRIVHICKEVFGKGDDYVKKITGNPNVDRPLQRIREFRNRPEPKVVVTVDMLSTGVDIPALEFIVFLRPVKSRILWEQMLGRGTRLCPDIYKDRFTMFDCFNGSLIEYFNDASNFEIEAPQPDPVTIRDIIFNIYNNTDRDYNINRLVKRLRRIEKNKSPEAGEMFAKYISDGDIGKFAEELPSMLKENFGETMKLLKDEKFMDLLEKYPKAKKPFWIGYEVQDEVTSEVVFEAGAQYNLKPKEYLEAFSEFVKSKTNEIEAIKILLERPQNWNYGVLKDLREVLMKNDFAEDTIRKAHSMVYHKHLVDIISMVKHAAREQEPVLNVQERVDLAIDNVFGGKDLNDEQMKWIGYIREHLIRNLTIEIEDFEYVPVFEMHGGLTRFKKLFEEEFKEIIEKVNAAIAA